MILIIAELLMSTTLGEMRTNIRRLLDDLETVDGRWSDGQINTAIVRAASQAGQILAQCGWDDILSATSVALNNGVATIPANDGIKNLFIEFSDGSLTRILPGNGANRSLFAYPSTSTVRVEYYAKTEAPEGDGYTVTYADVDVNDSMVDEFTEYLAASRLKTVEGEQNPLITQAMGQLEAQIRAKYTPAIQVAPAVRWNSVSRLSVWGDSRWFRSGPTSVTIYR